MNITLKKKKLQNGKYSSLFLEYYKGSTLNSEGKRVHLRDFEYLKLYPHQVPKTAETGQQLLYTLKVYLSKSNI